MEKSYSVQVNPVRVVGVRNPMLYGHFIEHFHRQIYGGVFDPQNALSDEDGFRTDIIEAMRKIRVPVLRWPGGCFVSSYHWKDAVGENRTPVFDKSWRVEDPNTFGTDEYIKMCEKIGCEPYICTNAGTGTAEEMSDWVEYCNLKNEGKFAKQRIQNGHEKPYGVKYWSIGNENYGGWEIGAKTAQEWGNLVCESAKMMQRVDPTIELSAAALSDVNWTLNLLQKCGGALDWISIHSYWDMTTHVNDPSTYEGCMAFTEKLDDSVKRTRGILTSLGLEKKIRIAYDEWNLRSWHHPFIHSQKQGITKNEYLVPRDRNDDNRTYTMADAVFSACFLNMVNRNCDIVGMANFAPILNTRGCIFSFRDGIVLRSTYHVFDLYVNYLGDTVLDMWSPDEVEQMSAQNKYGHNASFDVLDILSTKWSDKDGLALSVVNKHPDEAREVALDIPYRAANVTMYTVKGKRKDSYNDVGHNEVFIEKTELGEYSSGMTVEVSPHSVNIIQIIP